MRFRSLVLLVTIVGLFFLVACGGKKDEEDALRLSKIEDLIQNVFNEDQTDLAAGVTLEELAEIGEALEKEDDVNFSEENAEYLERLKHDFMLSNSMFELDLAVHDLFSRGVLGAEYKAADLEALAEDLAPYEASAKEFFDRLNPLLEEAFEQLELIEEAKGLLDDLFDGEAVANHVNRELEDLALEAVRRVVNDELRLELLERLDEVDEFLTAAEELEEKREEERRKKEEEERKRKEEEERKRKEEEERRAKSIGDFAGYYVTDEEFPFYCEINEERFDCFVPESDVFDLLKIKEIVHNTGTEVTLILEDEETGRSFQQKLTLLDGGKVVEANLRLHRITEEEFTCRLDGC